MELKDLSAYFDSLRKDGVEKIVIEYQGESDDGWVECVDWKGTSSRPRVNLLIQYVESQLEPGWEIDDGSSGSYTFDLVRGTLTHQWEERIVEIRSSTINLE